MKERLNTLERHRCAREHTRGRVDRIMRTTVITKTRPAPYWKVLNAKESCQSEKRRVKRTLEVGRSCYLMPLQAREILNTACLMVNSFDKVKNVPSKEVSLWKFSISFHGLSSARLQNYLSCIYVPLSYLVCFIVYLYYGYVVISVDFNRVMFIYTCIKK